MFKIRYASEEDHSFWRRFDQHLPERELELKIYEKRAYVIHDDDKLIGIMRYNMFWDTIPFLTLIYLDEAYRQKGFGKLAMMAWETEMRASGYTAVMTSTQVDESAQHFYRNLGYREKGALFLDHTPFDQPQEMIMVKIL